MANELKASNLHGVGGGIRSTYPGTMRRPVRLDFDEDDEEVVVMGENKRSTHHQSSQQEQPATEGEFRSDVAWFSW